MVETIKIKGLDKLQMKIKNLRSEVEDILSGEIEATAENIELEAKQNAPSVITTSHGEQHENGEIRNSLSAWQVSPLEWNAGIITTGKVNDMAAYVEFGTGKYIDIPEGLEAYAMLWYVNGKGTILPQPFLFPAVEHERVKLVERLKQDLKEL